VLDGLAVDDDDVGINCEWFSLIFGDYLCEFDCFYVTLLLKKCMLPTMDTNENQFVVNNPIPFVWLVSMTAFPYN